MSDDLTPPQAPSPPALPDNALSEPGTILDTLRESLREDLAYLSASDHAARALSLYEIGHLKEIAGEDRSAVVAEYERALSADRGCLPALRALARNYALLDRWPDHIRALENELEYTVGELPRARLLYQLAEAVWWRVRDPERARSYLESSLALVPQDRSALDLARLIYTRTKNWPLILPVLRQLLNICEDSGERSRLATQMAQVLEIRLARSGEAEELYSQALDLDPANQQARLALRRLYVQNNRWQLLSELLAAEVGEDHSPAELFADVYAAARIAGDRLSDDARSASLLETAAVLRPGDVLSIQGLIDVYTRMGRAEELAFALERFLNIVDDPQRQAEAAYRLARVYDSWLGQPEKALNAAKRALVAAPTHRATTELIAHLYEKIECWDDLIDLKLAQSEHHADPRRRAREYAEAAAHIEAKSGDLERALRLYERSSRTDPRGVQAFRALDRLYRALSRWEPLVQLYRRRMQSEADPVGRSTISRQCAWIYERELADRGKAIVVLERIREELPDDQESLIHLARLYEQEERFENLRDVLLAWAKLCVDKALALEIRCRAAAILDRRMCQADNAIIEYEALLESHPEHASLRDALREIYERTQRWESLIALHADDVQHETNASERARILHSLGRILAEKMGRLAAAQQAYRDSLGEDPSYSESRIALEELLNRERDHEGLVGLLRLDAELRPSCRADGLAIVQAADLCRAAEISEQLEGRIEDTSILFHKALELDPTLHAARDGLERIHLLADNQQALAEHYRAEVESVAGPLTKQRSYLKLAALLDRGGSDVNADEALNIYQKALQTRDDDGVRQSLMAMYRGQGAWKPLSQALEALILVDADSHTAQKAETRNDVQISLLKEWAAILDAHGLDQWDRVAVLKQAWELDRSDEGVLRMLDRMASEKKNQEDIVRFSVAQAKVTRDESLKATFAMRALSSLCASRDYRQALSLARQAIDESPTYLPLIRLLRQLEGYFGRTQAVADLSRLEGANSPSASARSRAWFRAGHLLRDKLGDPAGAKEVFRLILAQEPSNPRALVAMDDLLMKDEQWSPIADYYRQALRSADQAPGSLTDDQRYQWMERLVYLYRKYGGDPEATLEQLDAILARFPSDQKALREKCSLLREEARWHEAEVALADLCDLLTRDAATEEACSATVERADILITHLGDLAGGRELLVEALTLFPDEWPLLGYCTEFFRAQGEWERLAQTLERLAASSEAKDRVALWIELSELLADRIGDRGRAEHALRRALVHATDEGSDLAPIRDYFERNGEYERMARITEEVLARIPAERARAALPLRLARAHILVGRLRRPEEAEAEIRRALISDPDSIEASLALASLFALTNRVTDADELYRALSTKYPFCVGAYCGRFRLCAGRGDIDQAALLAQVAVALGSTGAAETQRAAQAAQCVADRIVNVDGPGLTARDYSMLIAPRTEPTAALALLKAGGLLMPQLSKRQSLVDLFIDYSVPDNLEVDKLSGSLSKQVDHRLAPLARFLGLSDVPITISEKLGSRAALLCYQHSGPRLEVAPDLGDAVRSELYFVATRALAPLISGAYYIDALGQPFAALLTAALFKNLRRAAIMDSVDPVALKLLTKEVGRVMPRRRRRDLEPWVSAYDEAGAIFPTDSSAVTRRGGDRLALLTAGEIDVALRVLEREGASEAERAEILADYLGERFQTARQRLNLSCI